MSITTKQHLDATHQVVCEQQGEIATLKAKLAAANEPFQDADSRITINPCDGGYFEYRIGGNSTAPFKTWREAHRAAEAHLVRMDNDSLKAQLAQVEADCASMREALKSCARRAWTMHENWPELEKDLEFQCGQRLLDELAQAKKEIDQLNKALALKLDTMPSGLSAGQSMKLERELAQLRTTAKRRLELLRKCEWMGHVYAKVCPNCGHSKMDGHANDCNWAAELKEPR